MNPTILSILADPSKIKRKMDIPINNLCNYTGLILGPKGTHQKKLEEETRCKILIRGNGSQKEGFFI
jgi:rRNA processing protein Krr1/Pno1